MPAGDWVPYEERIDLVLHHVYEHLDQPLDLLRLAEIAGFSPRHWHRVFTAAFGETLPSLVKRVRMQRALTLLTGELPIREIARLCGYPNVSSFTRAFHGMIGDTPAAFRARGSHAEIRIARVEDDPDRFRVDELLAPDIRCVAMRHRGSFLTIDRTFHDLRVWQLANGLDPDALQMYGVYLSDPTTVPEADCESLACVALPDSLAMEPRALSPDAPAPEEFRIPGGTYARLTHVGPYADMPESYAWLFGCWLPHSGRELRDEPVVERYLSHPSTGSVASQRTELLLPLRSRRSRGSDSNPLPRPGPDRGTAGAKSSQI